MEEAKGLKEALPGDLICWEDKLYRVVGIDFDFIHFVKLLKVVKACPRFNLVLIKTIPVE